MGKKRVKRIMIVKFYISRKKTVDILYTPCFLQLNLLVDIIVGNITAQFVISMVLIPDHRKYV